MSVTVLSTPIVPGALALALPPESDLWVFGYGSLMWDPGFPFVAQETGVLRGYHRRFCIYSTRHRGTPERPGLVFGLDHGGSCRGMVFRVAAEEVARVLDYLWAREMSSNVYRPKLLPVRLESGARVAACAFVVDRAHPQYCRHLDLDQSAALIRDGVGGRGPNIEYLTNTLEHLHQLGIVDHGLEALLAAVTGARPR